MKTATGIGPENQLFQRGDQPIGSDKENEGEGEQPSDRTGMTFFFHVVILSEEVRMGKEGERSGSGFS